GRTSTALWLAAIARGLVAHLMFGGNSRAALVTVPVILGTFLLLHLRWQAAISAVAVAALLAAVTWYTSPHLRETVDKFWNDYHYTTVQNNESGMGSRLIYWGKSLAFFRDAPLIG